MQTDCVESNQVAAAVAKHVGGIPEITHAIANARPESGELCNRT
jgi:hypothetical protein